MTIQIEAGIPLTNTARGARESKYPFAQMRVGDSFACVVKPQSLRSVATSFAKKVGGTVKFAVRATEDGARVWRVA